MFDGSVSAKWFESWFDSHYYHLLYSKRDESEAREFIGRICKQLQLGKGARVLDLACGKGRHAIALAEWGCDVTGADLSPSSIEAAQKHAGPHLNFVVHDMRRPVAVNYFDAVMNLFTSFGYFDSMRDNKRVIDAVSTELKHGGYFVLDYLNSACVRKAVNECSKGEATEGGVHFNWEKTLTPAHVIKTIQVKDGDKKLVFQEKVQLFTVKEMQELLKDDFEILNMWGDYSLEKYDEERSSRMIILARKK